MGDTELGVLVAVGPDGVRDGALDFAAAEALRRRTGVELVHVVHSLALRPTDQNRVQSLDTALLGVGQAVLADAADRLRPRLYDKVPLSTAMFSGMVAGQVVERARGRQLVVLERRDPDRWERLLTMSISARVAARAVAPVVVVPRGAPSLREDLPVTVGVDSPTDVTGQVETAAAYAAEVGRGLTVLFAMWLAEPYQDLLFVSHTRRQWTREADTELRTALERADLAGASVTRKVRWARPADALVDASRRSSVLVLGRRPARGPHGVHLGAVTRAVLLHAECPVLVADRI